MQKIIAILRKNVRYKLMTGCSLASMMFVFQACYGVPNRDYLDRQLSGTVTNEHGDPVAGIKISVDSIGQYEFTDSEGHFVLYVESMPEYLLRFADTTNVAYQAKDTLVKDTGSQLQVDVILQDRIH